MATKRLKLVSLPALVPLVLVLVLVLAAPFAFAADNATGNATANVTATPTPAPTATPTPKPTAETEAKYYVNSGETLTFVDTTFAGRTYKIAAVNGLESLVFDDNAQVVANEAKLKDIIDAYTATAPLPFKADNLANARNSISAFSDKFNTCRLDKSPGIYYNFTRGIGSNCYYISGSLPANLQQCWMIWEFDLGLFAFNHTITIEKANVTNGNKRINASLAIINDSLAQVDVALATNDRLVLAAALLNASGAVTDAKSGVAEFLAGHNYFKANPTFASEFGGRLARCTLDDAGLSAALSELNAVNRFPNASSTLQRIIAFEKSRREMAEQKRAMGPLPDMFANYQKAYDSFTKRFKALSGETAPFADNALKELTDLKAAADNASTATIAIGKATSFKNAYATDLKVIIAANATLDAYSDALDKLDNASASLATATKVYGTGDQRIADLDNETKTLLKTLQLKEADLKQGRPVTAQDFSSLSDQAAGVSLRATTMQRRENELDPVLIGGIILIIVLVVGAFIFLTRFRVRIQQSQPKEAPIEKLDGKK